MQIEVIQADITQLDVDAIVIAANERMLGGGGVPSAVAMLNTSPLSTSVGVTV